ncbi:N-acetyl-D-glucosamine kinase [Vibrio maritimus]|uniref:N-acetyl-D-glucosamine kinase n=1 Tax=Vibrio maritimus TaxID=990268 RepID=A0A090T6I4_9VIBR|nr:N-acetyl-D-glucosamine kinase [Vibrio maritimus]
MYYGFDVGGTKIEFGAFNEKLERVATERVPTPVDDYQVLVDTLAGLVAKYDAELGTEGKVGLGLPGMEDADDGTVLTVNIGCAKGKPLRHDLQAKIGREVKLENDANCFALSEAWDDELKDSPSVMGLILGTGFGGGLIYEGKVFSGRNNVAGELGHMRLPIDAWFHLGEKRLFWIVVVVKKVAWTITCRVVALSFFMQTIMVSVRKRLISLKRVKPVMQMRLSLLTCSWNCWLSALRTSSLAMTRM